MSKRLKIALWVVAGVILIGFYFLKVRGNKKYDDYNYYYAYYPNENGIGYAANVTINQHPVGLVKDIHLIQGEPYRTLIKFSVLKKYRINKGTCAIMETADIFGNKRIALIEQDSLTQAGFYRPGDTLLCGSFDTELKDQIKKYAEPVLSRVDTAYVYGERMMEEEKWKHLEAIFHNIEETNRNITALNKAIVPQIGSIKNNIDTLIDGVKYTQKEFPELMKSFKALKENIDSMDTKSTSEELQALKKNLNQLDTLLKSEEGSYQLLIANTPEMKDSIAALTLKFEQLADDIKENRKRYISIWGTGPKRQARIDKRQKD